MKFRNFSMFLLIGLTLFGLQCRKHSEPPTELPPITQEGKNTFGCKIDGKLWVPYYRHTGYSQALCRELYNRVFRTDTSTALPLSLSFRGSQKLSDNSVSMFSIETPMNNGISGIGNKFDSVEFTFMRDFHIYGKSYYPQTGKFEITKLDTANKIIAGIFEFTLYISGTDSIKITEGRFDLKFDACKTSK